MKKQVATLIFKGKYKVIFDDQKKENPYSVIAVAWDKTQKQLARFACLDNALQFLTDEVRIHRINNHDCVGSIPAVQWGKVGV